jgi:TolB-like protein/Flp pilus assembly protein TadD
MLEFQTLGAIALSRDGAADGPVVLQPKRLALLSYLVIARPHGIHRRDTLVALFWPESDSRRARNALSQGLHDLRSLLGADGLRAQGNEGISIAAGALRCDANTFDQAMEAGRLEDAMSLYAGELLDGLHTSDAPGFERWLDAERSRFRRRARDAAVALAAGEEQAGNVLSAARWLERGFEISPTDEGLVRHLITVLDNAGDRAGALVAYERLTAHLDIEYESEPSAETRSLISGVRSRRTGPVKPARRSAARERIETLAVLPLDNLSSDPGQDYLADGMTEALITRLANLRSLRVISRQSVLGYKSSKVTLQRIGRELGVDAVVEGSVLVAGDHVRITAQLVRVEPEEHLWADAYDGTRSDLLTLQSEVARAIAEEVRGRLTLEESNRLAPGRAVHPAAYDEFMRGVATVPWLDLSNRQAIAHFERAAELDPLFAEPRAWLATADLSISLFGRTVMPEARAHAIENIRRAELLDPTLGAVHSIRGGIAMVFEQNWEAADAAFARADGLGGGEPRSYSWEILYRIGRGQFAEGIAKADEFARIDPVGPPAQAIRGWALHKAHRFDEAIDQLSWASEMWPQYPMNYMFLAASLVFVGRKAEAAQACVRGQRVAPGGPTTLAYYAATLARAGRMAEACEIVDELERTRTRIDPFCLAVAWAGLGNVERTLDSLERIVEEGSAQAWIVAPEPFFDLIRGDPRFDSILDRLGLPRLEF